MNSGHKSNDTGKGVSDLKTHPDYSYYMQQVCKKITTHLF